MFDPENEIERLLTAAEFKSSSREDHRDELRAQVMAVYNQSHSTSKLGNYFLFIQGLWRWMMIRPVVRLGIPVLAIATLSLGAIFLATAQPGYAFEDLIKPLIEAKSGRCKIVAKMKDMPAFTFDTMFRGNVTRQESKDMNSVFITDQSKGVSLTLSSTTKEARILQQLNRDPEMATQDGFLDAIRKMLLPVEGDERVEQRLSLGERELAGRKLIGYRLSAPGNEMDLWGDQETGLPHTIVSKMSAFPGVEITLSDFEFDVAMEDSLFSLVPPAGYKVIKDTLDMSLISEEGFISALQHFADINDGVYPDEINLLEGMKLLKKYEDSLDDKNEKERENEVNRVRKLFAGGFVFPLQLSWETDAAYAGNGINRNQAKEPIFWYKPKGADKYRIIFADLTTTDAETAPEAKEVQRFSQKPSSEDDGK